MAPPLVGAALPARPRPAAPAAPPPTVAPSPTPVGGLPDAARVDLRLLMRVDGDVRACRGCGLADGRTNAVPGEGAMRRGVLVIGEAPGRNEDRTGRPFAGAAGRMLDQGVAAAGLTRDDLFITSSVKCRPPGNRDPRPEELDACRGHLRLQMEALRPRAIVALGRHGLAGTLGIPPALHFFRLRGTLVGGPGGIPVFVSLHPAAVIYRPQWRPQFVEDWRALGEWVRGGAEPARFVPPGSVVAPPKSD